MHQRHATVSAGDVGGDAFGGLGHHQRYPIRVEALVRKTAVRPLAVVVLVLEWREPCLVVVIVVVAHGATTCSRIATPQRCASRGQALRVLARIAGHIGSDSTSTDVRSSKPGGNP